MNEMNNNQITKVKSYNICNYVKQNQLIDGLKIWFSSTPRKKKCIHWEQNTKENSEAPVHER